MKYPIPSLILLSFSTSWLSAQDPLIDGNFDDWANITGIQDAVGDGNTSGVDLLELKAHAGERELLVYAKIDQPANWRGVPIRFYIDADGDASTGLELGPLGADYQWNFATNNGVFYDTGSSPTVRKGNVIGAGAPLEDSAEFEFAIPYSLIANGTGQATDVRISLFANTSQDRMPEFNEPFSVSIPAHQPAIRLREDWAKRGSQDIRIISWNVWENGPSDETKDEAAFGRQIRAINPDIVHFQEMYYATTTWVRGFMQRWVPAPPGKFWFVAKKHDCITASLFPITRSWAVDNNLILEINTSSVWGHRSIMINAHTPCCEEEQGRINETVNMLRWIEDAWADGTLTEDTPLLFIGDFNTATSTPEIQAMRTGVFPNGSGRQVPLTGDGSELSDLAARQIESPYIYTWLSGTGSTPSRLDYFYYPHTYLWPSQSFVLAVEKVSSATLQRMEIQSGDAFVADHKILGGDFRLRSSHLASTTPDRYDPAYLESPQGTIFRLDAPWHYSHKMEWFWSDPFTVSENDGYWIYQPDGTWLWTSQAISPWTWNPATESWQQL